MKKFVIIAAGGVGMRMESDRIKQFMKIAGIPILMHTIKLFYDYDNDIKIILPLPKEHIAEWENLCKEHLFNIRHTLAEGGKTRFQSVKNSLKLIDDDGLVGIHDGVRPFVSKTVIKRCFEYAEIHGNAIPVINVNETARVIKGNSNESIERRSIRIVQTPQVFNCKSIKDAYDQSAGIDFTDDANVLEASGSRINLVEGNIENIKITKPLDLVIARAIFDNWSFQ